MEVHPWGAQAEASNKVDSSNSKLAMEEVLLAIPLEALLTHLEDKHLTLLSLVTTQEGDKGTLVLQLIKVTQELPAKAKVMLVARLSTVLLLLDKAILELPELAILNILLLPTVSLTITCSRRQTCLQAPELEAGEVKQTLSSMMSRYWGSTSMDSKLI